MANHQNTESPQKRMKPVLFVMQKTRGQPKAPLPCGHLEHRAVSVVQLSILVSTWIYRRVTNYSQKTHHQISTQITYGRFWMNMLDSTSKPFWKKCVFVPPVESLQNRIIYAKAHWSYDHDFGNVFFLNLSPICRYVVLSFFTKEEFEVRVHCLSCAFLVAL